MIHSQTKKILAASLLTLLATAGVATTLWYKTSQSGELLKSYITALSEQSTQQSSIVRVGRLVQETAAERDLVASAFFRDEGDSISFLDEVESFAAASGLKLETTSLDKKTEEDKKTEFITIGFAYTGEKSKVMRFTEYLETLPYHTWLEGLSVKKGEDGVWRGDATLRVTIKPS